jgi:CRISPR/Cas system-associated exonuclease Cas4 (RecB family)
MAYERNPAYVPGQKAAYKISRSKIDLFMQCPRCFWLDARLKISRPSSPPFQINKAIDTLMKKEFDAHRAAQTTHPLMKTYELDLVPFQHANIDIWRDVPRTGVEYLHPQTNLLIWGGVDDIWTDLKTGELVIVDYKATSKAAEITLDAEWQNMYKRQLEIYQWLFRGNGFKVSDTGYFVYANGRVDLDGFYDKVEFKTKIISYTGSDSWVEPTIIKMKKVLDSDDIPEVGKNVMDSRKACEFCSYAKARAQLTINNLQQRRLKVKTS